MIVNEIAICMNKSFTKDTNTEDDELDEPEKLAENLKNYMTPSGCAALQEELRYLQRDERPKIVEVVAWAAGNGDRSENGDYIYGKKRLREIDRRIKYIKKRLDTAEIVDPERQKFLDRVFFGATVTYVREDDTEHTVTLVGIDEANLQEGKISWISPVATALLKCCVGDTVEVRLPSGSETLEVVSIRYQTPEKQ